MHKKLAILAFGATGMIAAAVHAITLGNVETYKDWTVGCDNGLACQAVALAPENMPDDRLSVVVKRGAGIAAPLIIEIAGEQNISARYRLSIDGRIVASAPAPRDSDFVSISGGEAIRLARAMARGRTMVLASEDGAKLGTASLAGVSAALRHIDARQGRAGSRGAIVANGRKRSAAKTAALPVISAARITPTDMLPDTSALVALSESSPCASSRFGSTQDTAYSLGMGPEGPQALVLLNCGSGAYNFSSGVYVGQRDGSGKWSFTPASFDHAATGFDEESKIPVLVNADWDAATQTLSSYAKGRGLGDCGSSQIYVWDGGMFRLTGATVMGECRGSLDWIPVWRAEVRLVP